MAILFYDKGEHPNGFYGYRVIGNKDAEKVDRYFSINKFGHNAARKLAKEAEVTVLLEREELYVERRLFGCRQHNQMAVGLTARLRKERKYVLTHHEYITRFIPCFMVSEGLGKQSTYRIHLTSYNMAFTAAVNKYCEYHSLSVANKELILKRKPDPDIFTDYLLKRARKEHGHIAKEMIIDYLWQGGIGASSTIHG